ncbi:MAG: family 20 glycosylhydrolase [Caldilineales bacterium]|nr:family 20 glycosylhydrolase [Caldilineales bacterium]
MPAPDLTLSLLPAPRYLSMEEGESILAAGKLILLNTADPQLQRPIARRLQNAIRDHAGVEWTVSASSAVPKAKVGLRLNLVAGSTLHPQGYELKITPEGIDIIAATPAGIHYGSLTLLQIIRQYGAALPCLRIEDWPDFPNRGVMLDISRDKVPSMATLFALIDKIADWKINQLQLYTEHTFAYQRHPLVWADASPLTGEEILALDAYCRERFIELVPNQNTFGHMYRWLRHEPYSHLAEVSEGAQTPWGFYWHGPYSLAPANPASLDLVRDMLDELLPHFSSRQVNVGCDETFDVGQGQSKKLANEIGVGQVYLEFLLKIYREVKARGETMQFWGDIIVEHPELVPELPRDAIAMEWGYEADHPFDEHGALFAASSVPFYVCPGTSSWRTLAGRTDNAVANLRNAAEHGLKHGAIGYLITDWGDNGHWQPLPVSYLGLVYGSALAWHYHGNRERDIVADLNQAVFEDEAGRMGRIVCDMGNLYRIPGIEPHNSSVLFNALQASPGQIRQEILASAPPDLWERLHRTIMQIDDYLAELEETNMRAADAALIKQEFVWAGEMLKHGCERILWVMDESSAEIAAHLADAAARLIDDYATIWHERNRPGGFGDSVARMQEMCDAYLLERDST